MNRKHKIIVSIVGIFIILLGLVGITYGYFLTKISGNTNDNSIYITTANLRLVYSDAGDIGTIEAYDIKPGDTIATKTFTVSNEGNADIDEYRIYLENVINDFVNTDDVKLTLSCSSNIEGNTCYGYDSTYPKINTLLVSNSIKVNEVHTYTLKVEYVETYEDQSEDMGKTIQGKIQIYNPKDIISISGTVTNYEEGQYAELHSEVKTSQIIYDESQEAYTYIFHGVTPGNHEVYIKSINDDTEKKNNIVISKGTDASITEDGLTITTNDDTEKVVLNIDASNMELEGVKVVQTKKLSDVIIANAKNATKESGRTIYRETPLTIPAEEVSSKTVEDGTEQNIYLVLTNISIYGTNEEDVVNCYWGEGCDNDTIEGIPSLCEDVKNKYVYDMKTELIYYISGCDGENPYYTINGETSLSITEDDYGTSYYYRGNVIDNYVNFANMCFRIIRIAGDGSIKIILEDQYAECNDYVDTDDDGEEDYKYTGNWELMKSPFSSNSIQVSAFLNPSTLAVSYPMVRVLYTFQENKLGSYLNSLKSGDWCYDDVTYASSKIDFGTTTPLTLSETSSKFSSNEVFYYDSYVRLYGNTKISSMKCNGTIINEFKNFTKSGEKLINAGPMYVGAITADEIVYAGGAAGKQNSDYYLINDYQKSINLQLSGLSMSFWTLSLANYTGSVLRTFIVTNNGLLTTYDVWDYYRVSVRPAINLKSDIKIIEGGDGTQSNPYTIASIY